MQEEPQHGQIHDELQCILEEDILNIQTSMQTMLEHRLAQLSAKLEATLRKALDRDDGNRVPLPPCESSESMPRFQESFSPAPSKVPEYGGDRTGAILSEDWDDPTEECKKAAGRSKKSLSNAEDNRLPVAVRSAAHYFNLDLRLTHAMLVKQRLPSPVHTIASSIVNDNRFNLFIATAILLNALFTAISTNWAMTDALDHWGQLGPAQMTSGKPIPPMWMQVTDLTFSVVFLAELILRMVSEEVRFLCGNNVKWNVLDMILVATAWSDIILDAMGSSAGANYSFMRLLRVLRVMRSFRIVRVMHLFKELRVVLLSLLGSIVPLFWALFCVFILIFLFIIVFMQGLAQYVSEQPGGDFIVREQVIPYFGTFGKTFRTLLMAISGGQDWHTYYDTMKHVSGLLAALFILYICLMTFGTLNVITAIMVENATSKARQDFEVCKAEEQTKLDTVSKQLISLFEELQPAMGGTISREQWDELCVAPDVASYFHMLGIDISKGQEVWRLLDLDGSNELDIDEFVAGCLHIQGAASYVDVESLMRANKTMMNKCVQSVSLIQKELTQDNKMQTAIILRIMDKLEKLEMDTHESDVGKKVVV